jgi:hypothetical protein
MPADELSRLKAQLAETQANLIKEQYSHELTKVTGDIALLKTNQDQNITCVKDHEDRIRGIEDEVISLKSRYAFLFGGVGLLALIAVYRSFFP